MKRLTAAIVVLLAAFCFMAKFVTYAAEILSYGQINVSMPNIRAELRGVSDESQEVRATLGSEQLQINDVRRYDNQTDSARAFVLVDLSTSMRNEFAEVKKSILAYVESMGPNDSIVLMTFGEKEVNTVLNGSESREEILKGVELLRCTENGTLFYEALKQAYQIYASSVSEYDREYVIVFSDGIDLQKGNSTYDEVYGLYTSRALPIYAACSPEGPKEVVDKFGELSRASGGMLAIVDKNEEFKDFLDNINDVVVVDMEASSNIADGQSRNLSVFIGDRQVDYMVPINRSSIDNIPPAVVDVSFNEEKNVFVLLFSETVTNADSRLAYTITDSNGKPVDIDEVYCYVNENRVEICPEEKILSDTYNIEFHGIVDASQEKNVLTDNVSLQVETSNTRSLGSGWIVAIIAAVLLFIVALLFVFLRLNKSKNDDTLQSEYSGEINNYEQTRQQNYDVEQFNNYDRMAQRYHIKSSDVTRVQIRIKTGNISEQIIDTNIVSSLIIGRASECDICVDDPKLSRQHFVIESDDGTLYIMDLQSRNGTVQNGICVTTRRTLKSGDKIVAGLSEFIIKF